VIESCPNSMNNWIGRSQFFLSREDIFGRLRDFAIGLSWVCGERTRFIWR